MRHPRVAWMCTGAWCASRALHSSTYHAPQVLPISTCTCICLGTTAWAQPDQHVHCHDPDDACRCAEGASNAAMSRGPVWAPRQGRSLLERSMRLAAELWRWFATPFSGWHRACQQPRRLRLPLLGCECTVNMPAAAARVARTTSRAPSPTMCIAGEPACFAAILVSSAACAKGQHCLPSASSWHMRVRLWPALFMLPTLAGCICPAEALHPSL